jgi:hypothetical protein
MNLPKLSQKIQPEEAATSEFSIKPEDQIRFYETRIKELEAGIKTRKATEEEELIKKAETFNLKVERVSEEEPVPWWKALLNMSKVDSKTGLYIALGVLALVVLIFVWYPVFKSLNDSELRIYNAARLHFISHVWIWLAAMLLGFGFQFLAFNEHFRYLWSTIETQVNAKEDFRLGTQERLLRLCVALATWAFPVWIFAEINKLILG